MENERYHKREIISREKAKASASGAVIFTIVGIGMNRRYFEVVAEVVERQLISC